MDEPTWPEIRRYVEDLDPAAVHRKVAAAVPVVPTIVP